MASVPLAVECVALRKRYRGGVLALDSLNLSVGPGESVGIMGHNGAGKTTLFRVLQGLIKATDGSAEILGAPAGSPSAVRRLGAMGDIGFYPFLTAEHNLQLLARYGGIGQARVREVLRIVGLEDASRLTYGAFSLGMKQRLALGAAIVKDPELLILDEPSNGLDMAGQLAIRQLISGFRSEGRALLIASHNVEEVELLCDRACILDGGNVAAQVMTGEGSGDGEQLRQALLASSMTRRLAAWGHSKAPS